MSPLTLQSALLIMIRGGKQTGTPSPLCLHTPISIRRFAESVGWGVGGGWGTEQASRFIAPKLIGGPSLWRNGKDKEVSKKKGEPEREGFIYNEAGGESVKETGRNEMIYVCVQANSSLNAAHWIAHISFYSYCGTESKLRKASKRNRKWVAPLNAALLSPSPPLIFFLFSPSIPQGGNSQSHWKADQYRDILSSHIATLLIN